MKTPEYPRSGQVALRGILLLAAGLVACTAPTAGGPSPSASASPQSPGQSASNPPSSTAATPAPWGPIGLADRTFSTKDLTDRNDLIDVYTGRWPVAIYATPATESAHLGAGWVHVVRNGTQVTLRLEAAQGQTLGSVANDHTSPTSGAVQLYAIIGKLLVQRWDSPTRAIDLNFSTDTAGLPGSLKGTAGTTSADLYYFRNGVEHFGPTVPIAFAQLAGTWKGPQQALTCGRPDVTVTISADGRVEVRGQGNLNCTETVITSQWDGQDDYVAPLTTSSTGSYEIVLDSQKGGGSTPQGGIRLVVPALSQLAASASLIQVNCGLEGMAGNLTVNTPARQ